VDSRLGDIVESFHLGIGEGERARFEILTKVFERRRPGNRERVRRALELPLGRGARGQRDRRRRVANGRGG